MRPWPVSYGCPLCSPLLSQSHLNVFSTTPALVHGSSLFGTCYTQCVEGLSPGRAGKSQTAHLQWHTSGPPTCARDLVMWIGTLSFPSRSAVIGPVAGCSGQTNRVFFWCSLWLLPFPDKQNGLGYSLGVSSVLYLLADCLSNRFQGLVVSPPIHALIHLLKMCSNVPILEHRGHAGITLLPHVQRLDELGRMF